MQPSPTVDSTSDSTSPHTKALRAIFANDVAQQQSIRPHYTLDLQIYPDSGFLMGEEQIWYPNQTGDPLSEIVLRLYPNFPRDVFGNGGDVRMDVLSVAVEGKPMSSTLLMHNTALRIPLETPLLPGDALSLSVSYSATIVPWDDANWPLQSYYPTVAVYDEHGWRLDYTNFADIVYAETAFYEVLVTIPSEYSVIATGTTVETRTVGQRTTYTIYTGPVREFSFSVGDFEAVSRVVGAENDITITVYKARGSFLNHASILEVAVHALQTYEYRFGLYPYRELDIHLLPGRFDGGWEHPGLIFLSSDAQVDGGTRYVAAHEVAHQWWYGVVGNDIYHAPWLDEAFAQYSGIIYAQDNEPQSVVQSYWEAEVMRRYRASFRYGNLPIGLAITEYPGFSGYYQTVYGKGSYFLNMLRYELGDDAFFAGLQRYYRRHRYDVATTADVQHAFEAASNRDLSSLFQTWVAGQP